MADNIEKDAKQRMHKCIEKLKNELGKIRTGRAHPEILDNIMVSYYGADTPLNGVATISVESARTLVIKPFEKNMVAEIEKSILKSDLGITPNTTDVIRLNLPALTEERRKELAKQANGEAEKAKIAVRNIRRDANTSYKEMKKNKEISEDDERRYEEIIQKMTDLIIKDIDSVVSQKQEELMII